MFLEYFVVNDDRNFDQFSDIWTPRMPMAGLRMSSNHLNTFSNATQKGFGSLRILSCNATDPILEIF
jgi:hypothetical protein